MESLRTPVPPFENTVSAQATGLLQAGPAFVRTYGGGLQGRMVRSLEMAQIPLRSDETDELMEQQYRYGATLVELATLFGVARVGRHRERLRAAVLTRNAATIRRRRP